MDFKDFMIKFNFVTNMFVILVVIFASLTWALDSNGVWHRAQDVKPGLFGEDEEFGLYSFNQIEVREVLDGEKLISKKVVVNGQICFNGETDCISGWSNIVKSSQICEDGKAVVGFDLNGDIICRYPNAEYR